MNNTILEKKLIILARIKELAGYIKSELNEDKEDISFLYLEDTAERLLLNIKKIQETGDDF